MAFEHCQQAPVKVAKRSKEIGQPLGSNPPALILGPNVPVGEPSAYVFSDIFQFVERRLDLHRVLNPVLI
jgi:hypothetical protein